ncbi:hypothetical protein [Nostoc sp. 106C]|uniref:hypothetical protein n=1 Tax=Nostoc sp. 106C TaxID=1932667 RepID=UPI000A371AE8|nr:hypothetical protein [Nostoc sp. 106C]OUL29060.1 hypothetical protein BV378_06650 [Nostoc sp. RF31YmG]OUL33718.1 hypothetical protein BV375_06665 [Nostoc sp. 106C]
MLRLYHLLIGATLVALIPVGVKYGSHLISANNPEQKAPVVQTLKTPNPASTEGNIWQNLLGNTSAPTNWQVAPCKGNAPLLCVSSKGKLLGTVEIGVYPLEKTPAFQKQLEAAGISTGTKADYQSPQYQTQLLTALKAWVTDYYTTIAKDRQVTYKNQVIFSPYPPQAVTISKLPGIRYGFAGLKQQGGVQEQHIAHVTFDGTALYVISSAFDPASETGKFDKLEDWAIFQPYFYAIAADLRLPK